MRFAVLAITTALLSAGTNLAAPDATTLVSGYKRLLTLTEEIRDDLARLTTANAFLVAPKMVTGFTNIGGELTTQAELVRNGAEPLADDEQQRACDTVSQLYRVAAGNLRGMTEKASIFTSLPRSQVMGPLQSVFASYAEPGATLENGFREAAPNCAQQTIDNGPDITGLLADAVGGLSEL